ncbi:MAG: DUF308 domain-containing protein [Bacilli bacterium]|nr:DUF308 domain-containing protein [Bacilli bacterium]
MKIKVKDYSNVFVLVSSIIFLILGAVMYTKPDAVVIITTYVFGGLLILIGVFKCVKNYLDVKKDNTVSSTEMVVGIVLTVLGIICIFLAGVVEAMIRLVIGGWMIFSGINRLINALYLNKKTSNFWVSLISSIVIIGGGLYTILEANLAFQAIGIVLMIYSVLEIIGFIFNKRSVTVITTEVAKNDKVIDAEVIETKDNSKRKKDSKK